MGSLIDRKIDLFKDNFKSGGSFVEVQRRFR